MRSSEVQRTVELAGRLRALIEMDDLDAVRAGLAEIADNLDAFVAAALDAFTTPATLPTHAPSGPAPSADRLTDRSASASR
jgi:hypothetical protein